MCWSPAVRASGDGERRLLHPANWKYRPRAAVELLGKLSFNVLAQGREAGLPAERPSGAVG